MQGEAGHLFINLSAVCIHDFPSKEGDITLYSGLLLGTSEEADA